MSFLQTLASAFKGGGDRVPLARTYSSPWILAEAHAARAPFEYQGAVRRAYLDNPVAQRAVRLVSESIGQAPLLAADAKLSALIGATSAGQPLLETLAAQIVLHGNAFVQVVKDARGKPIELFALRPERMSAQLGEDGWPVAWTYRVGESQVSLPVLDDDASPNVIHIRHFHPVDDHYGAGCLSAADQAVAIHNAASLWNRALLDNSARPSGALVYDA
ncbi:MAG: phage portal protein, partial [Novosphingobium sp.]